MQAAEAKAEAEHVQLSQQLNEALRKVNNSGTAIEAIEAAESQGSPDPPIALRLLKPRQAGMLDWLQLATAAGRHVTGQCMQVPTWPTAPCHASLQ